MGTHLLTPFILDKSKQPPALYAICKRDGADSPLCCPVQGCSSFFQENRKMHEHLCDDHNVPAGLGTTNVDTLPEGASWPFLEPTTRLAGNQTTPSSSLPSTRTSPEPDGPSSPPFTPLKWPAVSRTLTLTPGTPHPPPPDSPDLTDITDDQCDPLGISLFTESSRADSSSPPQAPSAYGAPAAGNLSPLPPAQNRSSASSSSRVPQATTSQVANSLAHPKNLLPFYDDDENGEVQGPTFAETGSPSTVSHLETTSCELWVTAFFLTSRS